MSSESGKNGAENEQVEKHLKAQAADEAERRMRERHAQAPAAEAAEGQPAAQPQPQPQPQTQPNPMTHNGKPVRDYLAFWVYADGSYHVEGPTEDHMRFVGLLGVLRDLENRNWNQICTAMEQRAARDAAQAATPQGKKGAMRRLFGDLGRRIQKGGD